MQEPKRLRRSEKDRMIFGVAGGLGEYFDIDSVLVRLVLVLLAFASGGAIILVYLVAAVVMPVDAVTSASPPGGSAAPKQSFSEKVDHLAEDAQEAAQKAGDAAREYFHSPEWQAAHERRRAFAGLVLVTIGLIILAANFGWFGWFDWGKWWPIAVILAGVLIIAGRTRGYKNR